MRYVVQLVIVYVNKCYKLSADSQTMLRRNVYE